MRKVYCCLAVLALLLFGLGSSLAQGKFTGRVAVEWITGQSPERDMRLLEPFAFTDPSGKLWAVPAGVVIDGASIPKAFWTLVGSPYVGNYRRASVVHDYFCDQKTDSWKDVHRMFYYAMVAGGVVELEAKVLYAAVYAGGPRWKTVVTKNLEGRDEIFVIPQRASISNEFQEKTNSWIKSENPTIEMIDGWLDSEVTIH
jgi:hypothetical protein